MVILMDDCRRDAFGSLMRMKMTMMMLTMTMTMMKMMTMMTMMTMMMKMMIFSANFESQSHIVLILIL